MNHECNKKKIMDLNNCLGLIQIIDQPTRIIQYSINLIDLILVSDQNVVSAYGKNSF